MHLYIGMYRYLLFHGEQLNYNISGHVVVPYTHYTVVIIYGSIIVFCLATDTTKKNVKI